MAGQLGQMALDVAEGEPRAGLLSGGEHVGSNQLAGLDHAHGTDRKPALPEGVAARVTTSSSGQPKAVIAAADRAVSCDEPVWLTR